MSPRRAAPSKPHSLTRLLGGAAILVVAGTLAACQSTSPLLFENRLDRNIKVDAVVPVFEHRTDWNGLNPRGVVHTGSYQRAALVDDHSLWDAAKSAEGERFFERSQHQLDHHLSISIRDASLINPRFAPLTVSTPATARSGYLAVAEAIDATVYLILADDQGTRLDQASTPLLPPK